jgi:hypothetical protein
LMLHKVSGPSDLSLEPTPWGSVTITDRALKYT